MSRDLLLHALLFGGVCAMAAHAVIQVFRR